MALGGFGGMLPRKVFKNLDTVMAILALFEQFLWQILFNFFASYSKSFTKYCMIHFVSTFLVYACLRRNDDCYQIGLKLWKNCIHQKRR